MIKEVRFAPDSALEEAVTCEPVSEAKFPARCENTGNFARFGFDRLKPAPGEAVIQPAYGPIPCAPNREIFLPNREANRPIREPFELIRENGFRARSKGEA
jgi:hypothetical protein